MTPAEAIAELRAMHTPFRPYDVCDCNEATRAKPEHVTVDYGDYDGCTESAIYTVCAACCISNGHQTEECASGHRHGDGRPICPTAKVLDQAIDPLPEGVRYGGYMSTRYLPDEDAISVMPEFLCADEDAVDRLRRHLGGAQ